MKRESSTPTRLVAAVCLIAGAGLFHARLAAYAAFGDSHPQEHLAHAPNPPAGRPHGGHPEKTWTPDRWKHYLHILADQAPGPASSARLYRQIPASETPTLEDHRFYLVPTGAADSLVRSPQLAEQASTWPEGAHHFRYEGSFTSESFVPTEPGPVTPPPRFAVFSFGESGSRLMLAENLVLLKDGNPLELLEHAASLINKGARDPGLDLYFETLKSSVPSQSFLMSRADLEAVMKKNFERLRPDDSGAQTAIELVPISRRGGSRYGQYLVRKTVTSERLIKVTLDTMILPGSAQGFQERCEEFGVSRQMGTPGFSIRYTRLLGDAPPTHVLAALHENTFIEERSKYGRRIQREALIELLSVVLKSYHDRRKWSDEFVYAMLHEALETAGETLYTQIHRRNSDGTPGAILSVLGLSRAPYSKIRFFNLLTGKWEERYGTYGRIFGQEFTTSRPPAEQRRYHSWSAPVPLLGMESIYEAELTLPRPATLERVFWPGANQTPEWVSRFAQAAETKRLDYKPDLTKPILVSSGRVVEPVKLFVARDEEMAGIAYSEVMREVFGSLFDESRSLRFNRQAQAIYTFNPPREGKHLYGWMGFSEMPGQVGKEINGKNWLPLEVSPERFARSWSEPRSVSETDARALLEDLAAILAQVAESRTH